MTTSAYILATILGFFVFVWVYEKWDTRRKKQIDQAVLLNDINSKLDRCLTLLTAITTRQNELDARVSKLEVKVAALENA